MMKVVDTVNVQLKAFFSSAEVHWKHFKQYMNCCDYRNSSHLIYKNEVHGAFKQINCKMLDDKKKTGIRK